MVGASQVIYGLAVIFISIFLLFYIFDYLTKLGEKCADPNLRTDICDKLNGPTEVMIIILLIISGFIIMITTTGYILLSSA